MVVLFLIHVGEYFFQNNRSNLFKYKSKDLNIKVNI